MYNDLTLDDLDRIWVQVQSHIIHNNDPNHPSCILTDYSPSNNGRPQVRYKGVKYYISIVLCLRKYRIINPNYNIQVGDECSHLCHNPPCINIDWLVFEDGETNKTRSCCLKYGNIIGYFCPHNPVCPGCNGIVGYNV
jgi:hypothetical protein